MPRDLQIIDGCWQNEAIPAAACFKSCIAHSEFNFGSLTATAAWGVCEALGSACTEVESPPALEYLFSPS
eukprot:3904734-Rhodomonas_salina.1